MYYKEAILTDITGSPARSGHYTGILHFGQAEIADHYLAVFVWTVIEQILRLTGRETNELIIKNKTPE